MVRRILLAAFLAVALPACDGPTYTQERISTAELEEMVAAPLARAEAGDLALARQDFEALLARSGPDEKSDLLTAFGVALYTLDTAGDEERQQQYRRASLSYLERAIPATVARFGASHPEVALALNTYGDAVRTLTPDDPPEQVDQAYARAYAIRERTLGQGNAETLFALFRMAQVKGLPARTGRDPARIAEAAAMFEAVIRGREANPHQPESEPPDHARLALVEMYVRNGRMEQAVEVARTTELMTARRDWRCDVGPGRTAIAAALRDRGREEEAEKVLRPVSPPPPLCLFDPVFRRVDK